VEILNNLRSLLRRIKLGAHMDFQGKTGSLELRVNVAELPF
jgi:hypothetical protein